MKAKFKNGDVVMNTRNDYEYKIGDRVIYDNKEYKAVGTIVNIDRNGSDMYCVRFDDARIFRNDDARYIASTSGDGWWSMPCNLTKMHANNAFRVGARVRYKGENGSTMYGSVVVFDKDKCDKRYVYCDKKVDSDGKCININESTWIPVNQLFEVSKEFDYNNTLTITVNQTMRDTVLTDSNGQKVVVHCHPDDKFSERKGVLIALSRYYDGFADGDNVYTVEADGSIGHTTYQKNNTRLTNALQERLAYGNIFARRRDAEEAAKKVASVFSSNARTLP